MKFRVYGLSAVTAIALVLFAAPVRAQTASSTVCADGTTSSSTGTGICVGHGGIKAKATSTVHAHVNCVDGTVQDTGAAACSSHGGVKSTSSTTRTTTQTTKTKRGDDKDSTDAMALCRNGMYSHSTTHRGACTGHGGVKKFLKP